MCLLIPFFEKEYEKIKDNIAYVCGSDAKDLYEIISFKNFLSRQIEFYQLNLTSDRDNGLNKVISKSIKVILKTKDGKTKSAIANISNKGIDFNSVEASRELIQYYSFNEFKKNSFNPFIVREGISKKIIPQNWSQGFDPAILPDCCIYLNGEQTKTYFCLANKEGVIETAAEVCKNRINNLLKDLRIITKRILFSESFHEIKNNKQKANNCKSNEFSLFIYRAEKTVQYAVETDCKLVINYINTDDYNKKFDWCKNNIVDELKLELKLMSLKDGGVYEAINNCVYLHPNNKDITSEYHFMSNLLIVFIKYFFNK